MYKVASKRAGVQESKNSITFSNISSCERGEMKKGISSGSSERVDDELRLHSCSPLCFFAACVESAVEVAGFDEEEEEEEEEDEEEIDVLGKVGMNLACGSTFNNCL